MTKKNYILTKSKKTEIQKIELSHSVTQINKFLFDFIQFSV